MQRGRFIFIAALALVATGATAATTTPIVSTDFSLQDQSRLPIDWTLDADAGFELGVNGTTAAIQDVALVENTTGQAGAIWSNKTFTIPSFTMFADVMVDFHPHGGGVDATCPADGFAMAFGNSMTPATIGGAGGSMGLYSNDTDMPQLIAMEVNTWYGNDLDDTSTCTTGKNVTFEFSDMDSSTTTARNMGGDTNSGGAYIGQVTAPAALQNMGTQTMGLVGGGWYRYQWDVDTTAGTMDVYVTGLDASNIAVQNMKINSVTFAASAPTLAFTGRFGLAAGTGGGTEGVHVRQVVVYSPALPGGSAPPGP